MIRIGKYEFNSKTQADTKIAALGTATDEDGKEYPNHKHAIAHLGNLLVSAEVLDEEGKVVADAVYSELHAVDVLWRGLDVHPIGWENYAVEITSEGMHGFAGISYLENKI